MAVVSEDDGTLGHWGYRVTRFRLDDDGDGMYGHEIRRVLYDDGGTLTHWTEEPVTPFGVTVAEVAEDLARMSRATALPVFDIDARADVLGPRPW